jgi:guanylate kinase
VRRVFSDAVGVFIMPPSIEELDRRLHGRGTDSEAVIAHRMLAARGEMRHVGEFAYAIINDDLRVALDGLVAIVHAARLRCANQRSRYAAYFAFLEQD